MPMATARWRTASRPYYPALFMTVRRESAESPSETSGEPARRQACRSRESAIAAEALMHHVG